MTAGTTSERVSRLDGRAKAAGETHYTADFDAAGALHVGLVRSPVPHATIRSIDTSTARSAPGVVAVLTSADVPDVLCGRRVRDMPLLASDRVRFTGERVAVVLAGTRQQAERAALLVEVVYDELPAVFDAGEALHRGAPLVHTEPWRYLGAVVGPDNHPNLQSEVIKGSLQEAEAELAASDHVVDRTYITPSDTQGYLEPQAWLAVPAGGKLFRLRGTTKSPYRLREQISACLGLEPGELEVEPTPLGGDFGGKGAPADAALCVALARLTGRPIRLVLRSAEDLTTTDARHPSRVRVRLGCDAFGRLTALAFDADFAGGAYAAHKPTVTVNLHGAEDAALGYRLPVFAVRSRVAYTNGVPKGHMRAPGGMEANFAIESALDELAEESGISPIELRATNLLGDGDADAYGHVWGEARGAVTLRAAVGSPASVPAPDGWSYGTGVSVYCRATAAAGTSLRLVPGSDGDLTVEVPIPETGTGSHTAVRELLASRLGLPSSTVKIRQVATSDLTFDQGVGGSRVTAAMAVAVQELSRRWLESDRSAAITVQTGSDLPRPVLSYCAQVARVAVDQATGQVKVLELVSTVDVAGIVNPTAHQVQIDGGAVMGYGAAVLEDLLEEDGQIWAANLGEVKLPTAEDVPALRTVLVEGGRGLGDTGVKSVGELTNVAVAAAVANAVADATGVRVRSLPITAERVWQALRASSAPPGHPSEKTVVDEGTRPETKGTT